MILCKRQGEPFSQVTCDWGGEPVAVIGGGPSLTQAQIDFIRGKARVIAINNAYLRAPWADVLYAPDGRWWRKHSTDEKFRHKFDAFAGQKCALDATNFDAPHRLLYQRDVIWSDDRAAVGRCEIGHAGYQALNIAALAGGDPIILLGYDANDKGPSNWHEDHPWPRANNVSAKHRRSFTLARPEIERRGIQVINCSPGSAIDAFPQMRLEDALAACAEPAAA